MVREVWVLPNRSGKNPTTGLARGQINTAVNLFGHSMKPSIVSRETPVRGAKETAAAPSTRPASTSRPSATTADDSSPLNRRSPLRGDGALRPRVRSPSYQRSPQHVSNEEKSGFHRASSPSSRPPLAPTSRSCATHTDLESPATFGRLGNMKNVVGVIDHSAGEKPDPRLGPHFRLSLAEPMVQCADGIVRRFAAGARSEHIASGEIHDVPSHRVTRHIAGIEVSADFKQAAFMVEGFPVSPAKMGGFTVYPMPGGRFMVPQPGANDCASACELMMLLDNGVASIGGNSPPLPMTGVRRNDHEIMATLQEKTGRTPVKFKHEINYKTGLFGGTHASRKETWRDLSQKIDELGSCILTKNGHDVMLDKVREDNGKFFLTIRDPYHGTCMEFEDSAEFFPSLSGSKKAVVVEAIFLGKAS